MNSNVVMVRYGELSTKGKNIKDFIKKLSYMLLFGICICLICIVNGTRMNVINEMENLDVFI